MSPLLWVGVGGLAAALLIIVLATWPARRKRAGYLLALRVAGDSAAPLWQLSSPNLARWTNADTRRLAHALARLHAVLEQAEAARRLFRVRNPSELVAEDRRALREMWWAFFEAMMAVDAIMERYAPWYGIDYLRHPRLHARAFALCFAALCGLVRAGHRWLDLLGEGAVAPVLFDEAMPDLGMPAGTFTRVRARLGRSRDLSLVPVGAAWFDRWIARYLRDPVGRRLGELTQTVAAGARESLGDGALARTLRNEVEVLKAEAFVRWFPLQRTVAEWLGDTRLVPEERRLVTDSQLEALRADLRPGDILVTRRNWYLSNLGLPGFWPHAVIYVGTPAELDLHLGEDPHVLEQFGRPSEILRRRHPEAWRVLATPDAGGQPLPIIEAVSEGVLLATMGYACGADYVAALRPRMSKLALVHAIDRALGFYGRPYDFNFDFTTDDAIVCSELVMKSFERDEHGPGLKVPSLTIAGRATVPPNEMVRTFAQERERDDRQLDFVGFLDGIEAEGRAEVRDADALARSCDRPKWDLAQA